MNVVTLTDVSVSYRGTSVLRSVSLQIPRGGVIGVRGRNGSGKSVLLKTLCGFVRPDSGEVCIDPAFLSATRTFPDRFGVLINGPAFSGSLSALQNLRDLASIRGRADDGDLIATLELVGLDPRSTVKARAFSSGMRQKLGLAQALIEDPQVLVLDEPFTALDSATVDRLRPALRRLNESGVTVVVASHDPSDFEELAADVHVISDGVVTRVGA